MGKNKLGYAFIRPDHPAPVNRAAASSAIAGARRFIFTSSPGT